VTVSARELPGGAWLVGVSGRLDQSQTADLESALLGLIRTGHSRLAVDFTAVTYINSGGLRCLVTAWRQARSHEGDLVLCSLGPRLRQLFTMVGFDHVFAIYPTSESAEQYLSSL
jgi:anti-sigma B factor antagonist